MYGRAASCLALVLVLAGCGHVAAGAEEPFYLLLNHAYDERGDPSLPTNACLLLRGQGPRAAGLASLAVSGGLRLESASGDRVALGVVRSTSSGVGAGRQVGFVLAPERLLRPRTTYRLVPHAMSNEQARDLRKGLAVEGFGDPLVLKTEDGPFGDMPVWRSAPEAGVVHVNIEAPPWEWDEIDTLPHIDSAHPLALLVETDGPGAPRSWLEPLFGAKYDDFSFITLAVAGSAPKGERHVARLTAIDAACHEAPAPAVVGFEMP